MDPVIHAVKSAQGQLRESQARLSRALDAALAAYPDDAELAALLGRKERSIQITRVMRARTGNPEADALRETE